MYSYLFDIRLNLDPFKRAPVPPESILNTVEETQGLEKVREKTQGLEKFVLKRILALLAVVP